MENPIKMDDLGGKPTIFGNIHILLHPRNLTWNLKISPWKRKVLLETMIFRFHVKFRGCTIQLAPHVADGHRTRWPSPPKRSLFQPPHPPGCRWSCSVGGNLVVLRERVGVKVSFKRGGWQETYADFRKRLGNWCFLMFFVLCGVNFLTSLFSISQISEVCGGFLGVFQ